MNRNKQIELVVLAVGWLTAVMFQFIITDAIASHIVGHAITDLKDELFVGFGVCLFITAGIYFFAKSRIEFESAFIVSVGLAVFLGFWPNLSVKDSTDWRYPIFFMECAPMCALLWKGTYRWILRVNNVEANKAEDLRNDFKEVVKADSPSKAIEQGKAVVGKVEDLPKEAKPIKPPPPQEPPAEPTQKSIWRID